MTYFGGTNKLTRNEKSVYNEGNSFKYLKYGVVVSNVDPLGLGRIQVRIKGSQTAGGDDLVLNADLPYCIPMIPKHLQVIPRIDDTVFIFVFDKDREHVDRMYIGPIISQLDKLDNDGVATALRPFSFGALTANMNMATIPELKGVFPKEEEISIQGRYNTDITQKTNEIILRAGKFESSQISQVNPYPFKFNTSTQAYIQIKNDVKISVDENGKQQNGTITNIVANKINLITHKDGSPRFNVTGQDTLISDDEMSRILEEAHQIPFGDVLLEYLGLLKDALFSHVHNGSGNKATDLVTSGNKQAVALFKSRADELEKAMLSKNIRVN